MAFNPVELPTLHSNVRLALNDLINNTPDKVNVIKTVAQLEAEFPPIGGVITLTGDNCSFVFDGSFDLGTNRLVLDGDRIEIKGSTSSGTTIVSLTTGNLIEVSQTVRISDLVLVGPLSSRLISASDATDKSIIIKGVSLAAGQLGIYIQNYQFGIITECASNGVINGIYMEGTNEAFSIDKNVILDQVGTFLDLDNATFQGISINHNAGSLSATGTFLEVAANGANIVSGGVGGIEFNKLVGPLSSTQTVGYSPLDLSWLAIGNNEIIDSDRLSPTGFGRYVDDNSGTAIVAGDGENNAVQFTINSDGPNTVQYLPKVIRGTGKLWDEVGNKITPITEGDTYSLRISFDMTNTSSNPTTIEMSLDIGVGAFPSIDIYRDAKTLRTGGLPARYSFNVNIFSLATFLANGCRIYMWCNSGTATLENRDIVITRVSSGAS